MKKILLVNGNYNDIPLVEAAHKLGFYVITSGNDPHGEAHPYADEYCPCDYTDKEKILEIAKEKNIDAICSCGNDFGAITAAYVAEKMGLPGHDTFLNSKIFHEKDEFKKVVRELSLSSPQSDAFTSEEEALLFVKGTSFPKIIKPVDLGGGKGVSVANNVKEAEEAIKFAFAKSKIKHIVVEDYIDGTQHGFICYIKDKKVVFDYSTNDYSYLNPYMVWIGSGYPADGYENVREQIVDDVEKIAEYKNIADGFLTIQYMMQNGTPYYLETMRRCLGNLHYECISRDCNVDLYELFIATESGLDCTKYVENFKKTGKFSGFIGLYSNKNGTYKDIVFDKDFEKKIFKKMMFVESGYVIDDYLNDKIGMALFSFNSPEERMNYINNRESLVKVILDD